jgi:hypothetical protein
MTVWERRDLPVLRALADTDDENILQGHLHLSADDESPLGLDLTTRRSTTLCSLSAMPATSRASYSTRVVAASS